VDDDDDDPFAALSAEAEKVNTIMANIETKVSTNTMAVKMPRLDSSVSAAFIPTFVKWTNTLGKIMREVQDAMPNYNIDSGREVFNDYYKFLGDHRALVKAGQDKITHKK
jgi:hypothetical protein